MLIDDQRQACGRLGARASQREVGDADAAGDAADRFEAGRFDRLADLLQSLLFVGYPRTLFAFGVWRKHSGLPAPKTDDDAGYDQLPAWIRRGEETCEVVYGDNYHKLRENVRALHPALETWMITEGYGRTLARPGLDLMRRELCIVAQTAVLETPRQLNSHLRGALNAGAAFSQIEGVLSVVNPMLSFDQWKKVKELWRAVRDGWSPGG